jgi:peptidoglycan/LPS O-acetylase OafA/YrhL
MTGVKGLALALTVTALGRIMMTHFTVHLGHSTAVAVAVASTPVLTMGYALILWHSIAETSPLQRLLCTRQVQLVGRWSYSLYLWHAYPVTWVSAFVITVLGRDAWTQYLAFGLVLIVLLPISALSFRLFEQPYFRWRAAKQPRVPAVVERAAI